jgi:uncharacterized phage-associated protein
MDTINALTLAEFILASYPGKGITPMKLQKLAYYTKAWTLVAGKPQVIADFNKWDFGPVNQEIYHAYKSFGGKEILAGQSMYPYITESQKEVLKFILDNYINFSAFTLSAMTHNEEPWLDTPKNSIISDKLILDYYSKQPFAKNFINTVPKKGLFHLLQSDAWHAFTLDMDSKEAEAFESFSSYEEFLKQSKKAEKECQEFFKEIFH